MFFVTRDRRKHRLLLGADASDNEITPWNGTQLICALAEVLGYDELRQTAGAMLTEMEHGDGSGRPLPDVTNKEQEEVNLVIREAEHPTPGGRVTFDTAAPKEPPRQTVALVSLAVRVPPELGVDDVPSAEAVALLREWMLREFGLDVGTPFSVAYGRPHAPGYGGALTPEAVKARLT